jgi:hypothetical protein
VARVAPLSSMSLGSGSYLSASGAATPTLCRRVSYSAGNMSSNEATAPSERFQFGCLAVVLVLGLLGAGMVLWAWNGAGGAAEVHWPGLRELLATGTGRADGIVIRSVGVGMPASRGFVYPIVRFEVDGKSYELKGVGRESEYLEPGKHVFVVYQKGNPTAAHLAGPGQAIPAIMLGGGGALLVGASVAALAFGFRWRPSRS